MKLNVILCLCISLSNFVSADVYKNQYGRSLNQGVPDNFFRSVSHPDATHAIIEGVLADEDYDDGKIDDYRNGKAAPVNTKEHKTENQNNAQVTKPVKHTKPNQKENKEDKMGIIIGVEPLIGRTTEDVQLDTTDSNVTSNTIPSSYNGTALAGAPGNQAQLAALTNYLAGSSSPTQTDSSSEEIEVEQKPTTANSIWNTILYGFDNKKPNPTISGVVSSALTSAINQYLSLTNNTSNDGISALLQAIGNLAGNKLAHVILNYHYNRDRESHYHHHHHHHQHKPNSEINVPFVPGFTGNIPSQGNGQITNSNSEYGNRPSPLLTTALINYLLGIQPAGIRPTNNQPLPGNEPTNINSQFGNRPSPMLSAELINYLLGLSNGNRPFVGNGPTNTRPIMPLQGNSPSTTNPIIGNRPTSLLTPDLINYLLGLQPNGNRPGAGGGNLVTGNGPIKNQPNTSTEGNRPTNNEPSTSVQGNAPMSNQPNKPNSNNGPIYNQQMQENKPTEPDTGGKPSPWVTADLINYLLGLPINENKPETSGENIPMNENVPTNNSSSSANGPTNNQPSIPMTGYRPIKNQPTTPIQGNRPTSNQPTTPIQGNGPTNNQPTTSILGNRPTSNQPNKLIQGNRPIKNQPVKPMQENGPTNNQPTTSIQGNGQTNNQPTTPIQGNRPTSNQPNKLMQGNRPIKNKPATPIQGNGPTNNQPTTSIQGNGQIIKQPSSVVPGNGPSVIVNQPTKPMQGNRPSWLTPDLINYLLSLQSNGNSPTTGGGINSTNNQLNTPTARPTNQATTPVQGNGPKDNPSNNINNGGTSTGIPDQAVVNGAPVVPQTISGNKGNYLFINGQLPNSNNILNTLTNQYPSSNNIGSTRPQNSDTSYFNVPSSTVNSFVNYQRPISPGYYPNIQTGSNKPRPMPQFIGQTTTTTFNGREPIASTQLFNNLPDGYNVGYDPAVLNDLGSLLESNRLSSNVISKLQTIPINQAINNNKGIRKTPFFPGLVFIKPIDISNALSTANTLVLGAGGQKNGFVPVIVGIGGNRVPTIISNVDFNQISNTKSPEQSVPNVYFGSNINLNGFLNENKIPPVNYIPNNYNQNTPSKLGGKETTPSQPSPTLLSSTGVNNLGIYSGSLPSSNTQSNPKPQPIRGGGVQISSNVPIQGGTETIASTVTKPSNTNKFSQGQGSIITPTTTNVATQSGNSVGPLTSSKTPTNPNVLPQGNQFIGSFSYPNTLSTTNPLSQSGSLVGTSFSNANTLSNKNKFPQGGTSTGTYGNANILSSGYSLPQGGLFSNANAFTNSNSLSQGGGLAGSYSNANALSQGGGLAGSYSNANALSQGGGLAGSYSNANALSQGGGLAGSYSNANAIANSNSLSQGGGLAGSYSNANAIANSNSLSQGGGLAGSYSNANAIANSNSLSQGGGLAGSYSNANALASSNALSQGGGLGGSYSNTNALASSNGLSQGGGLAGSYSNANALASSNALSQGGGLGGSYSNANALASSNSLSQGGGLAGSYSNANALASSNGLSQGGGLAGSYSNANALASSNALSQGGGLGGSYSNANALASSNSLSQGGGLAGSYSNANALASSNALSQSGGLAGSYSNANALASSNALSQGGGLAGSYSNANALASSNALSQGGGLAGSYSNANAFANSNTFSQGGSLAGSSSKTLADSDAVAQGDGIIESPSNANADEPAISLAQGDLANSNADPNLNVDPNSNADSGIYSLKGLNSLLKNKETLPSNLDIKQARLSARAIAGLLNELLKE